jgi:hypothetical protein
MRRSSADRSPDPSGGLGVEAWRRDDLGTWLKGGLEEAGTAAPGARVWRGIARESRQQREPGAMRNGV